MVLNPLGVPSSMNVGQILEIHLGRAAKVLGDQVNQFLEDQKTKALRDKIKKIFSKPDLKKKINQMDDDELVNFASFYRDGVFMATPVFDGAKENEIKDLLLEAGLNSTGQTTLYDGRSGEPFDKQITVGTMYVMKLHHLVDDKIHARSIGPYSLVTQQPLGGKAQFGGQRLGRFSGRNFQFCVRRHVRSIPEPLNFTSKLIDLPRKHLDSLHHGQSPFQEA